MTSRERTIAAIEHKEPDRIPRFDGFWEDTAASFVKDGLTLPPQKTHIIDGAEKPIGSPIEDFFNFDIVQLPMDLSMRFPSRIIEDDGSMITVEDQCGYTAKKFKGKASSLHFLSHKVNDTSDWETYKHRLSFNPGETARIDSEGYFLRTKPYPSWHGAKKIFDTLRATGKYITLWGYGPYENSWRFHGYENCLMDLLTEPDMMKEMFEKSVNLTIDIISYMIEWDMKPDGLWIAEDLGGTHTTLFSPETYRTCLWPYHKKLGTFLHEHDMHFLMHSCGKIDTLIPAFIEAGLDVIQALQANTGMDVVDLKQRYGKEITFFGNIAENKFASGKSAIEEELRRKIPAAMKDGGYIYHSDHSIPPEVTLETYLHAMQVLDEVGAYDKD
jgi:uroporphyrinogen decarboxylase